MLANGSASSLQAVGVTPSTRLGVLQGHRLRSVSAVVAEHPDGPPRRAAAFDVSEA